jgi:hypothetical protein
MSDLVRPSSLFGRVPAATAPSGVLATIPNPPPDAARLPTGTTLQGVVVGNDGKGHVLVRTELGVLAVATKLHLSLDSEVTLQVRSSGAQLHVLLMHSESAAPNPPPRVAQPPLPARQDPAGTTGAQPQPGGGQSVDPIAQQAIDGSPPGRLTFAQTVRAVLQAPAPPAGSVQESTPAAAAGTAGAGAAPAGAPETPPPSFARLPAGTVLSLRIVTVSAPVGPSGAHAQPAHPAAPAASSPVTPPARAASILSAYGGTAATQSGPLAPASTAPTSGPPADASGQSLSPNTFRFTGRVSATTHAGYPVLQTPLGTMTLEVRTTLPVGTRMVLEAASSGLPLALAAEPPASLPRPANLAHGWPSLSEAIEILDQSAAPGSPTPSQTGEFIPHPGPKLTASILFFLSALGKGDIGRWLGERALATLKRAGQDSLLQRIVQDFGQLARFTETPSGDWRVALIPLWDGQQVQPLRFFHRRGRGHGDHGDAEAGDEATRFILDVELSRVGDMQFDGFVRTRQFDLILRTREPLSVPMREDISRIFHDANETAGYAGEIVFQASAEWHFMPFDGLVPASASPIMV